MGHPALLRTEFPGLTLKHKGKVRDLYEHDGRLLIVATDRVSAFDVVLPNGIPDKGKILTAISLFWFDRFRNLVPNHLTGEALSDLNPGFDTSPLEGRTMVCRKLKVVPIECIVRGYLTGSGYKDYLKTGKVCGHELPPGLENSSQLESPFFTPSTKAETGHDENIDFKTMVATIGREKAEALRELSLKIYSEGAAYAASRGLLIADTKFEWGEDENGNLVLIDEVLTMDSSRFWPADEYTPGREQNSFDKQIVRNYLETLDWNKTPPGPVLPDEIVSQARQRYCEVFERLTGSSFESQANETGSGTPQNR